MEDEVDRFGDVEKLDAIHVAELEGVVAQMLDVLQRSRIEIVKAYDPLSLTEQMLAKVRPEKAGPSRHYRRRHADSPWFDRE
jgi:hypothetical protein